MAKRNILYIETGSGYGGSTVCLFNMLKCIDQEKVQPFVISYHDGPVIDQIRELGISVNQLRGAFKTMQIVKYIISNNIHIVHNNNDIYSTIRGIVASKITRKPVICHIRGIRNLTRREVLISRFVDLFITVSDSCKQKLIQEGIAANKIVTIYDGILYEDIDQAESKEQAKNKLNLPKDKMLVGLISRIAKGKGHSDFIEAVQYIVKGRKDVQFLVVGAGELKGWFCSEIERRGLGEDVFLLDWQKDLWSMYKALDVAVSASTLEESFGMVNVEAMACGCPVVATKVGAYPEIVSDRVNGFIVPPKSPNDLAEKIGMLLDNADMAQAMGQSGKEKVSVHFNICKNIKQIEECYENY